MGQHQKFSPGLIVPLQAIIVLLPVTIFPNKLAPKVPITFLEILLFALCFIFNCFAYAFY